MTTILNQHQAVVLATKTVLGDSFVPGVDVKTYISKEQRTAIISMIAGMFSDGSADLSEEAKSKFDTDQKLKTYTNSLVTNWFNKSKELNGGTKYEAKNPGSRQGSGDDQLKSLKALRSNLVAKNSSEEAIARVDEAISTRLAAISTTKPSTKLKTVDVEVLPEELKDLV